MSDDLTIAIPVFNRTTYFRQAVMSALNQQFVHEVLIVDNASDKVDFSRLVDSFRDPRIRYVRNAKNLGMAGNWNRAIDLCQTEYLLLLHDDDFLHQGLVAAIRGHFARKVDLVWCRSEIVAEDGKPTGRLCPTEAEVSDAIEAWAMDNRIFAGAAFRVDSAKKLGGFRTKLRFSMDWDMWFRLREAGRADFVDFVGASYRTYDDLERETARLRRNPKFHFYRINQRKRNFAAIGKREEFKQLQRTGGIPRPRLAELSAAAVSASPRVRSYYAKLCVFGPKKGVQGQLTSWFFRILGSRGLRWVSIFSNRGFQAEV